MNTNAIVLLSLCALAAFSPSAIAGQKIKADVVVVKDATGGYARGAIGTARNSTDTSQRIGCQVQATAGSSVITGLCDAASAQGGLVFCETSSPQLVQVIMSAGTDSYINFTFGPEAAGRNPTCTSINVYDSSLYEPKKP